MVRTTETVHFALPVGMTEWIDQTRGDVSRSRFVSKILEKHLKKLDKEAKK